VVGIVERGGRVKTKIVGKDEMSADDMRNAGDAFGPALLLAVKP
jgi:hypothetical protein